MLYSRPAGATRWEVLNPAPAPLLYSLPIETSDRTLYAFDQPDSGFTVAQLYFKRADEMTWIPTDFRTSPRFRRLTDDEGNLWTFRTTSGSDTDGGLVRLRETQTQMHTVTWGAGFSASEMHLSAIRGTKLYGQPLGYVPSFGPVFTWDLHTSAVTTITSGDRCTNAGGRDSCGTGGQFVTAAAVAPDGTAYEVRVSEGERSALFELDGDTWRPIAPDAGGSVVIDHHGTVYLANSFDEVGSVTRVND